MERSASSSICSQGQTGLPTAARARRPLPHQAPRPAPRSHTPAPPAAPRLSRPLSPHGSTAPSQPWFRSPPGSAARTHLLVLVGRHAPLPPPLPPARPVLSRPGPAAAGAGRAWLARPRRTRTDAPSPRAARGTRGPRPLPCHWPAARPPALPPSAHWLLRGDVPARALLTGPRGAAEARIGRSRCPSDSARRSLPEAAARPRRPRDPRPLPAGASRRFPAPSRRTERRCGEQGPGTAGRSRGRPGPPSRRCPAASQAVPGSG